MDDLKMIVNLELAFQYEEPGEPRSDRTLWLSLRASDGKQQFTWSKPLTATKGWPAFVGLDTYDGYLRAWLRHMVFGNSPVLWSLGLGYHHGLDPEPTKAFEAAFREYLGGRVFNEITFI